jgi:hypothetical protein
MRVEAWSFPNAQGEWLSGRLDLPDGAPRAWALFAHCFTCGKDILAARRIAAGHCQLSRPWYARCVGGAAARVGRSFARLSCCPTLTERGSKKAPWVR